MPAPDRIVRLKTVLARTGLSRPTIYCKIAEGTFPAQLKISTNGAGWRESDINRWVADPVRRQPEGRPEWGIVENIPAGRNQPTTIVRRMGAMAGTRPMRRHGWMRWC